MPLTQSATIAAMNNGMIIERSAVISMTIITAVSGAQDAQARFKAVFLYR